jgi:hypothetical protein
VEAQVRRRLLLFGVALAVAFYILLSLRSIDTPFVHVTEDVNGQSGVSVRAWDEFGWLSMRFGWEMRWINSASEAPGTFYAHLPSFFLLPGAMFYHLIGHDEVAVRLGSMIPLAVALFVSGLAFYELYQKRVRPAVLSLLILAVMPGTLYYGKILDTTIFGVTAMLLVFSAFVFYLRAEPKNKNKFFWLLVAVIFLSGLTNWYVYFLIATLWFALLIFKDGRKMAGQKKLLIALPLVSLAGVGFNLLLFYWQNGISFFSEMLGSYKHRTDAAKPFVDWAAFLIKWRTDLNFTWLFVATGLAGLLLFSWNFFRKRLPANLSFLFVLWIAPILIAWRFYQWFTHPFGPIVFLPAIAVSSAYLLDEFTKKSKIYGYGAIIVILLFGFYLSWQKQDILYDQFKILGENDVNLIEGLKADDKQVCLDNNQMGLAYEGIVEWYLKKKLGTIEGGNGAQRDCQTLLFFHKGIISQEYFNQRMEYYRKQGFTRVQGCAEWLCVAVREK